MTNEYATSTPKIALVTGGSRGIGRNTVSAGQKVRQIGRFDDAPCTALSGIRHTSARPRVNTAR
jgi:hypothetical protein